MDFKLTIKLGALLITLINFTTNFGYESFTLCNVGSSTITGNITTGAGCSNFTLEPGAVPMPISGGCIKTINFVEAGSEAYQFIPTATYGWCADAAIGLDGNGGVVYYNSKLDTPCSSAKNGSVYHAIGSPYGLTGCQSSSAVTSGTNKAVTPQPKANQVRK